MLQLIEVFSNLPESFSVDDVNFQAGQVGQLRLKDDIVMVTISDGLRPLGIIDDIRTDFFRKVVINEKYLIPIKPKFNENNEVVLSECFTIELKNKNIITQSFWCDADVVLKGKSGTLSINANTKCFYNLETSIFELTCSYAYNVRANFDDSTANSKKVTLWTKNLIAETDMFDCVRSYPLGANLYVKNGLFTTQKIHDQSSCIGKVMYPPTASHPCLRLLWDPKGNIDYATNIS